MFENPILIYSDYCQYCIKFLDLLDQTPELAQSVNILNIDVDKNTKRRPKAFFDIQNILQHSITEVPTIITENASHILSGEEAFKWLTHQFEQLQQLQQMQQSQILEPFNQNEMFSFSDKYAPLGSNDLNNATEQSFKFINKPEERIQTPQEDSSSNPTDFSLKQRERDQQTSSKPQNQMVPSFSTTNLNTIPLNTSFQSNSTKKNKGVDMKLQELLAERESLETPKKPSVNVNFNTGEIIQGK